jgi:hypothetical protein
MSLSRLYLRTRLDIFNVFLKYRRYTLVRSFVLPPFSPHFRRQFSTFLSRRLHQCTLVLRFLPTFNTSRFPLGAPSSYSPFSTSSLMSLRRLLRRRMRDRSRHFVYFKFVFSSSRLPAVSAVFSLQLFSTYVEPVFSMQFYSVPAFAFSSFTFFPFILILSFFADVLTFTFADVWVSSLRLDSCRIQTVCLIYRQRLDCLHSSSLSSWLLAVSHRSCAILFSFLVFRFCVPHLSFIVYRFPFLVFSCLYSSFAFLVPRSQFDIMALWSLSIHTFF